MNSLKWIMLYRAFEVLEHEAREAGLDDGGHLAALARIIWDKCPMPQPKPMQI